MSFETIKIHRQYPIINGMVQVPNNLERNKSLIEISQALQTVYAGSGISLVRIGGPNSPGPARTSGTRGVQEFIEMPEESIT